MKMTIISATLAVYVASSLTPVAASADTESLRQLSVMALSSNIEEAQRAAAALRASGAVGLAVFADQHAAQISQLRQRRPAADAKRLAEVLDSVAQQRDAATALLFWHTDLEQAIQEAKESGRPILSLRLLGRLSEEFSCANSRFFRTVLYANREIADYLRQHYVLHWESVAPAPRMIVDFGDGRRLERTITGNSIHYILAADGRVVDALPGLYAPSLFLRELQAAAELAGATPEQVREFQRAKQVSLAQRFQDDLQRIGHQGATSAERLSDAQWMQIGALHRAELDDRSQQLLRRKNYSAERSGQLAISKGVVEDPLLRMVRNLEESIARDTVRNDYSLRPQISRWLAEDPAVSVSDLNARVYRDLFLMPLDDPWYGLAPADIYSGIEQAQERRTSNGDPERAVLTELR